MSRIRLNRKREFGDDTSFLFWYDHQIPFLLFRQSLLGLLGKLFMPCDLFLDPWPYDLYHDHQNQDDPLDGIID